MAGFDETFDWVVVGSGAGSMSSALVMRKAGKSVVILEKTKFVGGSTAGAALQGRMLQAALRLGTDIRPESPVSELVVEDSKVTGVVTTKGGKGWRIGARLGVLVNAGGFAQNQAMRELQGRKWLSQIRRKELHERAISGLRLGKLGLHDVAQASAQLLKPPPCNQNITGRLREREASGVKTFKTRRSSLCGGGGVTHTALNNILIISCQFWETT